jgi:hypothetical protein
MLGLLAKIRPVSKIYPLSYPLSANLCSRFLAAGWTP